MLYDLSYSLNLHILYYDMIRRIWIINLDYFPLYEYGESLRLE